MPNIAKTRSQAAFAALETQRGQLNLPDSASSLVLASSLSASQRPNYTDSPEIQNSRGVIDRFADGLSAGEFSFKLIPRPRGAGSDPVGDPLFHSLMGQKTQDATTTTYAQTTEKPSFSLCYRKGHMVFYCLGATVTEMKANVTNQGAVELDFKGQFMRRLCMGDDQMAAAALAGETQIEVSDAARFNPGGRVHNPHCAANGGSADDNQPTGQGYEITAVDTGLNLLTLAEPLDFDWALGEPVQGWLPPAQTLGQPIASRDARLLIDGVVGKVQAMDLTLADPVRYVEDEITALDYPSDYVEGDRKVTGSFTSYFRPEDASRLSQGASGTEYQLDFVLGQQAGTQLTISLPRIPREVPEETENGPALLLKQSFTALETLGDDAASLVFA